MDLQVKLYPHVGKQNVQLGSKEVFVDVDLGQCIVHANGSMVGIYCGKACEPGKYLSFTLPLPDAIQAAIAAEVSKLTGGVGTYNAPPPEDHDVPGESGE